MKRARFTEEQIIGVLKEHEAGAKTADLARKHGVSEATLYNWKAKYGGMDVSEAKRLKQLEEENAKLKKLLAEQIARTQPRFSRASVKKMVVGPVAKREGVAHLQAVMGLLGTAGLLHCRCGSQDDPLPLTTRAPDTELRTQLRDGSPTHGGALAAIGACSSCCARTANRPGSTASTGSIAKKASTVRKAIGVGGA